MDIDPKTSGTPSGESTSGRPGTRVAESSAVLDDAYERLASSGFELPNGFVNHAVMACEALVALDLSDDAEGWSLRAAQTPTEVVAPERWARFDWQDSLGDFGRLGGWLAFFEAQVANEGPDAVIATWVPRLMPALSTALFHGAIRTAHAVRAVDSTATAPRCSELARSLAYWAARYRPGASRRGRAACPDRQRVPGEVTVREAVVTVAAEAARRYLAVPSIVNLHGVTGTMAVELFLDHLSTEDAKEALARVVTEYRELGEAAGVDVDGGAVDVASLTDGGVSHELAISAAESRDPHQVKLVEACRRGVVASGDPAFLAAARTVTGW